MVHWSLAIWALFDDDFMPFLFVTLGRTSNKRTLQIPHPETFRCDYFTRVNSEYYYYFFFFHNSAGRKLDMIDIDAVSRPAKAP